MSKYERVYNFSAGPSMLPLEVLENVQKDLLNYKGTGESVMEMSHRSAEFKAIIEDAEADLRKLMNIPDNYKVLFLQGGGTLQFSMIPLNLLRKSKKADYIVTGQWAKKAYKEACKFGDIKCVASSEEDTYSYIPEVSREDFRADADYVYICYNNTIYGSKFPYIPDTGDIPLVADMSSCILSEEVDVSRFGVIWAGAQKNVAPAGVTIVIIREDLIGFAPGDTPVYLDYKTHAEKDSMYNTPPCWSIYVAGEVFKYLLENGGVAAMHEKDVRKAEKLYAAIDASPIFRGTVREKDRSLMNVTFVTGDKDMDAEFIAMAKENGLINLKGHRTVGGLRASIYNAMPEEGVDALIALMKKFEESKK
ncbi:MAG: 3-phosphoserine/phosphohydroxythreonine transaminase [Clostridiales bacterium]|uniref:3-phosphoserine/phosphohydroxythreonine transaminase n=1 Tax=Hornefia butyriciproducens TaxID=2652293 RepID=UPI002A91B32B|nr:3-phosphoserine/phosphohydroxythreonine transaminase [Hornefia butyriciproducens]MCI7412428.1 3-phosphoserine/phosphohydroxythreonine transaminase [Clostridiales bacterium]MCI7678650.1 3-phosphoserine/phosphohydroxythreonine transaminase [Clostridiales bacterium]MDY6212233.1 3-phosphoserine/phosphohydroxythreonine transaminase [Hornefia butyriciproducens]